MCCIGKRRRTQTVSLQDAYYDAFLQFDEVFVSLLNRITGALRILDRSEHANVRMTTLTQATNRMLTWLTNQIDNAAYDMAQQDKENDKPRDKQLP